MTARYTAHLKLHPFIRFDVDLQQIPGPVWAMLGECAADFDHIAWSPLRSDTAAHLEQIHLAKYIQGTVAIEGTQLNDRQIARELGGTPLPAPSPEYDQTEIRNFVQVLHQIRGQTQQASPPLRITPEYLCELNRQLLHGTRTPEGINIGHFRHHMVAVHGYTPPHESHVVPLVAQYCDWLNHESWKSHPAGLHPHTKTIIRAVLAHLFFELIHPFGDGNGRVGRLLELALLCDGGTPWPCSLVLTNHYNLAKNRYFSSLNEPRIKEGFAGHFEFLAYAVEGLKRGLVGQLQTIQSQVLDVSWHDFIYERFRPEEHRAVAVRQRKLAIALSGSKEPVPTSAVPDLSPEIARAYAGKSRRLVHRDLRRLVQMQLVQYSNRGWSPNKNLMLRFMPNQYWRDGNLI
jgi:Fic family protein